MRARLHALRDAIRETQPDVVIAHAPHINVQTLLAYRDCPVIVAEHGDVALNAVTRGTGSSGLGQWRKALWYRLRRFTYGRAARVVSVSSAVDRNVSWVGSAHRLLIHDPLTLQHDRAAEALPIGVDPNRPWLISVGRLAYAKGFDVLLSAFAQIASRFPDWQLVIVGDGELRSELENQAKPLGEQVIFTGALANPSSLLKRARWFAMASRYEGFPIAHGEALLCGIPVIATDCPSRPKRRFESRPPAGGIRELMADGKGGVLVPNDDPSAFAAALARCMSDGLLRARCASEAKALAERFSLSRVVDEWEKLIGEVCATAGIGVLGSG
jgi:glycosyltransferase involved in cell wall biosynthesis